MQVSLTPVMATDPAGGCSYPSGFHSGLKSALILSALMQFTEFCLAREIASSQIDK